MGSAKLVDSGYKMGEETSTRIALLRWFGIFLVVLAHSFQDYLFASDNSLLADIPFAVDGAFNIVFSFVVGFICSGTVPAFFLMSGYLMFVRPKSYGYIVKSRTRSLFVPFVLWTAIGLGTYVLARPIVGVHTNCSFLFGGSLKEWFFGLVGNYNEPFKGGNHCTVMYQLWFVRDLFILALISPFIKYCVQKLPIPYFLVFGLVWLLDFRPLIVDSAALLMFSVGAFLALNKKDLFEMLDKWPWWAVLGVHLVFGVWAAFIGKETGTAAWLVQASAMVVLLKISKPLSKNKKLLKAMLYLSPFGFFMYCSHGPSLVWALDVFFAKIFDLTTSFGMIAASFSLTITKAVICTGLGIALYKLCPRVFAVLTGGRADKVKA